MKQKLENIQLLETPVGTDMYLMIATRNRKHVILRKVKYGGYSVHTATRSWFEPGMKEEAVWQEPEFTVKFTEPGKKTPITVKCTYTSYWTGDRGYDTDIHEECGTEVKGVKITDEYSCIDVFFSTDKEKIKNSFLGFNVIENLNNLKKEIDKTIDSYNKFFE